jgi:DNA-binding CsgD family transcriptional regulator
MDSKEFKKLRKKLNKSQKQMAKKPTYKELERRVNELEKNAISLKREVTRNKNQAKSMNLILESIPYPFYVLDALDYTVKKANHTAYPGRLPKGTSCFALTHKRNKPCDSAEHPCPLEIVKRTKQPVTVEHLHYDNDDNLINVEINAFPIFDSEGNVFQIIEYCLDVSQRKRLERQLENQAMELEIKTRNLEEVNVSLQVLIKKREEDKKEIEETVMTNVKQLIAPYFDKIQKNKLDDHQKTLLKILESNLNEIVSPFTRRLSLKHVSLTPKEITIVNMIKQGLHSKKIAELQNVSPRTIDTHRKNIRRKIGLQGQRGNLRSHLLAYEQ